MVGVTYRSASARPQHGPKFSLPSPQQSQGASALDAREAPSFKDKESYQELFKPLPKPDALPPLVPFKTEVKSWKQLQTEREALMDSHLEKTKNEAMTLWNRAKDDDNKRINKITDEQRRIEEESRAREEILRRGDQERQAMDKARKDELRRQEELLTGRKIRSKTAELSLNDVRGGGIQIYHYKDPAVANIIRNHHQEEIRRRMSHGEILRLPTSDTQQPRPANGLPPISPSSTSSSSSMAGDKNGPSREEKPDYFKASVMVRSQSSSSNTSR